MSRLGKKMTMDRARLFEGTLLLVLFVSSLGAEASMCETRSKLYRGACFKSDNCGSICEKEGFTSGKCKGFLRKCICAKDCGGGGGSDRGSNAPDNPTPQHFLH